jgi:hypothetical protein
VVWLERETPATHIERGVCIGVIIIATAGMVWLGVRTAGDLDRNHTPEFLGLALLAGLLLYLGWLLWALWTVHYELDGDRLRLRQGPFHAEVALDQGTHLHRWRGRWMWEGGAQRDLSVTAIALFPPFWLGRSSDTWVVQRSDKAIAIRPSAELLSEIKSRVRQAGSVAG